MRGRVAPPHPGIYRVCPPGWAGTASIYVLSFLRFPEVVRSQGTKKVVTGADPDLELKGEGEGSEVLLAAVRLCFVLFHGLCIRDFC